MFHWRFLLSVLCWCCFVVDSYSQVYDIDSMQQLLKTKQHDTNKILIWNNLSFELKIDRPQQAIDYANKALKLANSVGYDHGQGFALNNLGVIQFLKGNYSGAIGYYQQALGIYSKSNRKRASNVLNNIGLIYSKMGNYPKAVDHYFKSVNLKLQLKDTLGLGRTYLNLGNCYHEMHQPDLALTYYKKALSYHTIAKDNEGIARSENNIGMILQDNADWENALKHHLIALELRIALGNKQEIASSKNNIGLIYVEMGLGSMANQFLWEAIELRKETGNKEEIAESHCSIGYFRLSSGNYLGAIQSLDSAYRIAKEIKAYHVLKNTCGYLSEAYEGMNQYQSALYYQKELMHLKDSVYTAEAGNILLALETSQQIEERDKQLVAKENQIKVQQLEDARKSSKLFFLLLAIALIGIIALIAIAGNRQKRKANKSITEQKLIIEEKSKDIYDSIRYAKRIQDSILPSTEQFKSLLPDSFVIYKPKDIVAGDFYFIGSPVTNYGEKLVVTGVADCTGHGVPGALLTIIGKAFLELGLTDKSVNSCADALNYLNKGLSRILKSENQEIKDGMDIAFCAINFKEMKLEFAGGNNPLYIIRNGELIILQSDNFGIGSDVEGKNVFKNQHFELIKGDSIYLFSDGFADQFGSGDANGKSKKFKTANLKKLLISVQQQGMEEQKGLIESAFEKWKGNFEQTDDVCLIGIRI